MLDLPVLGLLKESPMHGYELRKALAERFGRGYSFGSLYPTLKRLAKAGAVEMDYPKGEIKKKRNVYRITSGGEQLFDEMLEQTGAATTEDRETFMLRLAFFRYTKPETRQRLLERRRGYLQDRLVKLKDSLKKLRERMDAYSLELMQYNANETEHDIRWLDTMIEHERRGGVPSP